MSDRFTCEVCGGTFLKGRTDEEARGEALMEGLLDPGGDNVPVCENCYRKFRAWRDRLEL